VIPILNVVAMSDEMTGNGKHGFTYAAEDPSNLERLIYRIMNDQSPLPVMIENGRYYVRRRTLENCASDYYKTINTFY
jgi:hypothetical protein